MRLRRVLRRGRRGRELRRGALRRRSARRAPRRRRARVARLWQPHRGRRPARGRDGARPGVGRRHRRDPLGQAGGPGRHRLRARHDRRDAGTGPAQRTRRRRAKRPLPEGAHRADSAAGGLGRRRDLELRHQPLDGQGGRAGGDRPGAAAGRPPRHQRRRRRGRAHARATGRARKPRRLHRRGALRAEYRSGLEAAGFEQISIEFTHEVADGMHGAIVKAVKTSEPEARGLPVVRPAARAGCC